MAQPIELSGLQSSQNLERIKIIRSEKNSNIIKVLAKNCYTLKELNVNNPSSKDITLLKTEFTITQLFNHPNIIKAYNLFLDDQNFLPSILFEYYPIE